MVACNKVAQIDILGQFNSVTFSFVFTFPLKSKIKLLLGYLIYMIVKKWQRLWKTEKKCFVRFWSKFKFLCISNTFTYFNTLINIYAPALSQGTWCALYPPDREGTVLNVYVFAWNIERPEETRSHSAYYISVCHLLFSRMEAHHSILHIAVFMFAG